MTGGDGALSPERPHVIVLSGALAFSLYALFLAYFMGAYAGGSDSSGYLNQARLLEQGRVTAPIRPIAGLTGGTLPPFAFAPLGFRPGRERHSMTPIYPVGLPLLLLAAAHITGWDAAPGAVIGLHALLGLCLVFCLGREMGLNIGWAWLATAILATSPLYLFMSLQLMSDVPAMVWATAALLAAWKGRTRGRWALAAGVATSVAVLIRPTNLLVCVPLAVALGLSGRRWLAWGAGALPGAALVLAYNHAVYGHPLKTGYGNFTIQLSWDHVPVTLVHYAVWLPVVLTPLGLFALGLPWLSRWPLRVRALLGVWIVAYTGFYLFYQHSDDAWWYLRFLLPAFPAMLVAAMLVIQHLVPRPRPWWWVVGTGAIVLHGALWTHGLEAAQIGDRERVYPETAAWLRANLPASAVVASMQVSGAIFYYTDFPIVRSDRMRASMFPRLVEACAAAHRPLFAVLFPFEREDALARMPGRWTPIGAVRHVTIWRFHPGASGPTPTPQ